MRATVRGSDGDGGRGSGWNRVDGGWEISSKYVQYMMGN